MTPYLLHQSISQMLMGDLNAEPDTVAIQFLMGLTPLPRAAVSSGGDASTSVDPIPPARLRDAWSQLHEEPEPRSTDEAVRYSALTFPSDEPKKRIDMILCGYVRCRLRRHNEHGWWAFARAMR